MKMYIIINEVDITQEMINRSSSSDWTKLRRNIGKDGGTLWKRIFTIEMINSEDIPEIFINETIYTDYKIKEILLTDEWN